MFITNPLKDGSEEECAKFNKAKLVLGKQVVRVAYVDALKRFNIDDGQNPDPDFDRKLDDRKVQWEKKL